MELLIIAFIAGALTVLAPCILPLLPIIVGSTSLQNTRQQWYRPLVIAGSLAASVVVFTLLLKATTALLGVPQAVWSIASGLLVIGLGITLVFPESWEWLMLKTGWQRRSNSLLKNPSSGAGIGRDIVTGLALGPVFSSCSPTYALIVAVVLPQTFGRGLAALVAYALGLASVLLLIGLAGQAVAQHLGWASNPNGWFRRGLGVLFVLVGIGVLLGWDHQLQTYILDHGWSNPIMNFETSLQ